MCLQIILCALIYTNTSKLVFTFSVAIHESGDKLEQLLMVLKFKDEAVLGATHTLVAIQGAGSEVAVDKDQDFVYQDVYFVPLVGGLFLYLD